MRLLSSAGPDRQDVQTCAGAVTMPRLLRCPARTWKLLAMARAGCSDGADGRVHDHLKPRAVRAAPVHLAAVRAAREYVVGAPGAGLQHLLDVCLAGG